MMLPLAILSVGENGLEEKSKAANCFLELTAKFTKLACPSYQPAKSPVPKLPLVNMSLEFELKRIAGAQSVALGKDKFEAVKSVPGYPKSQATEKSCWDVVGLRVFDAGASLEGQAPPYIPTKLSTKMSYLYSGEYNDQTVVSKQPIDCEKEVTGFKISSEPLTVMNNNKKDELLVNFELATKAKEVVQVQELKEEVIREEKKDVVDQDLQEKLDVPVQKNEREEKLSTEERVVV